MASSKTRKVRRKLKCHCSACGGKGRQGPSENMTYILRNEELLRLARRVDFKDTGAMRELMAAAHALLLASDSTLAMIDDAIQCDMQQPHVPGHVLLATIDDEGDLADHTAVMLQTIWGEDFTSFAGEKLRQTLQEYGKGANLAVWFTGFYSEDVPIHVFAADDKGTAAGWLCGGMAVTPMPPEVLAHSMSMIQKQFRVLEESDHFQAYQALVRQAGMMRQSVVALHEDMDSADAGWRAKLLKEREAVVTDMTARRRAALAAKNAQLDAVSAQVTSLTRQLSEAKAALAKLEKAAATPAAQPAGDSGPIPLASPPSAPTVIDDEASSTTRFTVEHQAEVIRQLRLSLRHVVEQAAEAAQVEPEPPAPRRLVNLADWAAENADRVIVLNRAISAARKGVYEDEELVYKGLDLLATTYRDVKLGIADRMTFKNECEQLGLDYGGSISEQPSSDYFFHWRGKRLFLDQHVGRGIARDPRYCFRTYFTWDESEAKVIIGWTPTHLPTRTT